MKSEVSISLAVSQSSGQGSDAATLRLKIIFDKNLALLFPVANFTATYPDYKIADAHLVCREEVILSVREVFLLRGGEEEVVQADTVM